MTDATRGPARPRPPSRRRLSEEAVELVAALLRVIGEPIRIRLLGLLDEGDATVQELAERLAATHQDVSKHLGVLHQAGLVSRRRERASTRYALIDWIGWWLVEQLATSSAAQLDERRGALG